MVLIFRCWDQLSNRSGLNKIHALPIFRFLVYRFHGDISIDLKQAFNQTSVLFPMHN